MSRICVICDRTWKGKYWEEDLAPLSICYNHSHLGEMNLFGFLASKIFYYNRQRAFPAVREAIRTLEETVP